MTTTGYVFADHGVHAREQFRLLAEAYDPLTLDRLARTGVRAGWRCLEVGAGGGSVAHWLAWRTGSVLATDLRPEHVPPAPGLTTVRHDVVRDPLPEGEFDLVHARLVLAHLPERDAVLRKLVRALKPGGWLQVEDFDKSYGPVLVAPDDEAAARYEAYLAAKERVFAAAGSDGEWGRKAAASMVAAGLVDVDPVPVTQPWRAGSPAVRLLVHHTHHLRDRLTAAGMTDDDLRRVRDVLADPGFRASSCVVYSVQGRRP
ncbi:class I SAM-dependent methyltransferase [Saccharothrix obliqua]|uniref:class I SAM-dependent methyltransferase n=1 Tax=Saccharothrix obliqua TaxID=2861747 RepID=UPI001C5ED865|nr:class I SAM-dependent methyltransferase [Saccharothrix obliqua]MBW4718441.1 class I SAM-dependent methyltransferase [Saccharothrix obliqua]